MTKYPKVVVFDLDYTLWPFWVDTHVGMPLKSATKHSVIDKWDQKLQLFPDVEDIILDLHKNGVTLVTASRTSAPFVAKELLDIFHVGDKSMKSYFSSFQWGTGSKITHIKEAVKELAMEDVLEENDIILFDDEYRNKDVERIGCIFGYLPDENGLTHDRYKKGLEKWKKNKHLL